MKAGNVIIVSMRTIIFALSLTVLAGRTSAAGVKEASAGVVAGYPSGGTAKLWFDASRAVDLGVGLAGSPVLWADALWHAWDILPQPAQGKLGAYLGGGPRLELASDAEFGLRTVVGVSWRLPKHPVELFAEAGPVFRFTQGGHVDADGGVGVRVSFWGASTR